MTYDLYLRENIKNRPDFAGDLRVTKEESHEFYERESEERRFLKGYEAYDKRQLRKMTHLERFSYDITGDYGNKDVLFLFDYENRNRFTHQAAVFVID